MRTVAAPGYKDFEAHQWYGVMTPTGTPPDIVANLDSQINQSLTSPELKTRLNNEEAIATADTPASFGKLIVPRIARWKPVIKLGRSKVG